MCGDQTHNSNITVSSIIRTNKNKSTLIVDKYNVYHFPNYKTRDVSMICVIRHLVDEHLRNNRNTGGHSK